MSAITIMNDDEIEHTEALRTPAFGCLETRLGNLAVKELDLKTRISGLVFETTVRQTYVNRYDEPLEATYIFPLPDRGAVREFKMIVAGRVIDGALKERGEARREYQQAIEQGHRASIVEEERPDTFTMRVGNIEPGEEATIEFKVTGPLVFADGEATFRFPLVVAPRYIPGAPLSGDDVGDGTASDTDVVPDASRISPPVLLPGFPGPIALSIEVEIEQTDLPVSNLRSSLHAITVDETNGRRRIEIRPGERVNRDFILRFDVAEDAVSSSLTYTRDPDGAEGTFMVTLVPPSEAKGAALPRDIVFVLDRSGSMSGWKMVAARRALGRMLDTLTPKDRFQVILFDNVSTKFGASLLEGSNRNRYRAIEDLAKVEARGGTEMAQPIFDALDMLSGGYDDRRRMVVLVTDGQVGNEQQIVAGVQQRMKNVRMFTVGIDQAVNAGFLNRLADLGGGRCELVESEDRLDDAMDRVHRTIDTPVLTELSVSVENADYVSSTLTPEREPDLFAGAPAMILGRFRGEGPPVVTLRAAHRDGSHWKESLKGRETADEATTAVWARGRVRALEDEYATRGHDPSLAKKITELSLRFGVLCKFTSWVAVDREAKIESQGDLRQVVQPVESPAGWESSPMPAAPMMRRMSRGGPAGAPSAPMANAAFAPQRFGGASGPPQSGAADAEFAEGAPFDGFVSSEEIASTSDAPHMRKRAESMTLAGAITGDARYMSPEQVRGRAPTLSSDVFVLGVIAFRLLTGRALFDQSNPIEIAEAVLKWDRAALGREPQVHGDWFDVLHRALAPDASERHADARELLDDLEARFGRAAIFGDPGWSSAWSGSRELPELSSLMTPGAALVIFAWLVSHVAHEQARSNSPVGRIAPSDIIVDDQGRARLRDHDGEGFFDRLKRWLGFESADGADISDSRRDEFWK